ncbi:MAG: tyrosine-type recombinase/integrase, partial [Bacteroidales bacterium]
KAGGEAVTPQLIRDGLNEKIKAKPQNKADTITLTKYFDIYIAELSDKINQRTGSPLSKTSIDKYSGMKQLFLDFCKKEGRNYDFADIDSAVINKLTTYLIKDKNYSVNTYGRALKHFKTVLYDASDKGYNKNTVYIKNIQGITEKADTVYLTESELQKIYELDLDSQPHLDRVRDMFLMGCWTGLRFSDFIQIKPDDVRAGRIRVLTQKTKQRVSVPVSPVVNAILEKYNYKLPKPISKNNFNDNIKTVAQNAGINETFIRHLTKGGKTQRISKEKFNFVSTHTARRSFATNMFLKGVQPSIIMGITGHTTEKEFFKYIKVDEEQKADMFQNVVKW